MRLPAEWERQSGVQLTWPDDTTPWYELEKVQECYARIAEAVLEHENLLIVTTSPEDTARRLEELARRRRHHDLNRVAVLDEKAHELDGLVGRDGTCFALVALYLNRSMKDSISFISRCWLS